MPRPCRSSRVARARKSWAVVRASWSGSCSGVDRQPVGPGQVGQPQGGPWPPARRPGQVQPAVQGGGHAGGVQHGGIERAAPQPAHRRIQEGLVDLGDVHHQHVAHGTVQERRQLLGQRRRGRELLGQQAMDADRLGGHRPVGAGQQPERGGRGSPAADHPQPPRRPRSRRWPGRARWSPGRARCRWPPARAGDPAAGGGQVGADGFGQVGAGQRAPRLMPPVGRPQPAHAQAIRSVWKAMRTPSWQVCSRPKASLSQRRSSAPRSASAIASSGAAPACTRPAW